jgi:UDP-glucose 4-epimerase
MKYLVTGGAGFIGSNLVDILLEQGNEVVAFDNLSSGKEEFISDHFNDNNFTFIKADLLDQVSIKNAMEGIDLVYHLAANHDVRYGVDKTSIDLEQGPIATHNILEVMREKEVRNIAFSSSSTVYGEVTEVPTPENYGPMIPISLYGASKLACEGFISAYCHSFDMKAWIFRFANVIGNRGTHGVIVDFINKLRTNPTTLEVLGDGTQIKSYLTVEDCVDAMILGVEKAGEPVNLFNLGTDDWITVTRIAEIVIEECGLENVELEFTGGERGWVGDVPKFKLSIDKISELGWKSQHTSEEAVRQATKILVQQLWDE